MIVLTCALLPMGAVIMARPGVGKRVFEFADQSITRVEIGKTLRTLRIRTKLNKETKSLVDISGFS